MVSLCTKTRKYSFTLEKNDLQKIILYRLFKELSCFEKHYGNLYSNLKETSMNIPSDDGGHIIFDVCHILICNIWPNVNSDTATQYSLQLAVLIAIFNQYKDIDVMKCYTENDVLSSFLSFIMHTDTLILLTLTQLNFGARYSLLQLNTFFGNPLH